MQRDVSLLVMHMLGYVVIVLYLKALCIGCENLSSC